MKIKAISGVVTVAAMVAGLIGSTAASAHGIWFAQRSKQLALIYGVGADDLDALKRLPLVQGVAGYDAAWKPVATSLKPSGPLVYVDSEAPLTGVSAYMDYGVWSKGKDGEWYKKTREEMPDATLSERTMKYGVFVTYPLASQVPVLPDQTLQIVPVTPLPELLGKPVTLKVLYKGKPQAGVVVLHDYVNDPDQVGPVTDAEGNVTIDVRNQGLNVIAATFEGPTDDKAKYDRIEYRATLAFVLPHAPE